MEMIAAGSVLIPGLRNPDLVYRRRQCSQSIMMLRGAKFISTTTTAARFDVMRATAGRSSGGGKHRSAHTR